MLFVSLFAFSECKDLNSNCEVWSMNNGCESNSGYMYTYCKKSCLLCDYDCENSTNNFETNFLNKRFSSIEYNYNVSFLSRDPWVVMFPDFLKGNESDHLISLCGDTFVRSEAGINTISSARTSSQCWCMTPNCEDDYILKNIEKRVSNIVDLPVKNSEFFQILKYTENQYYQRHHDQNCHHDSIQGARTLTFFIYLSDVEEGGETYFDQLNILVKPKKNTAILWNSIKDNEYGVNEHKTSHEAKKVIKGTKYAANLWFHTRNFRTPHRICRNLSVDHSYDVYKKEVFGNTKDEL